MIIKGKALWAHLAEPDTRFDDEGHYKVNLIVDPDTVKESCGSLEAMIDDELIRVAKKNPKLKTKLVKKLPWSDELDEEGDPTGGIEFKFKSRYAPAVVDSKKHRIQKEDLARIGNGSVVAVKTEPKVYHMASNNNVGVTLYLQAVQVIKLVERGAPTDDFDEFEDGYVDDTGEAADGFDDIPMD